MPLTSRAMGDPRDQRDHEPVRDRLDVFLQSTQLCRVRQAKGLERERTATDSGQPCRRNPGRLCGDHGADRDAVLKSTAGCKVCCYPVAGLVSGEILVLSGFSAVDNQNNRKIEEKINRNSTARLGIFRGFQKFVAGLRCHLALSGYFCMEGKLPMKEIPIWEKSNLSLEEAAAYSGIGINKLREITNEDRCKFVLWVGNKRLIKRRPVRSVHRAGVFYLKK